MVNPRRASFAPEPYLENHGSLHIRLIRISSNCYFHHTLQYPSLSSGPGQINCFVSADGKATEFVIFQTSHNAGTFDQPDQATHLAKWAQMVKDKLSYRLWMPSDAASDCTWSSAGF